MKSTPHWYFDEKKHSGIDYTDERVVSDYVSRHTGFRDYKKEADRIARALRISTNDIVIDMGCGSGGLSIQLAGHCKKLYAFDASPAMIELCRKKISQYKIDNISAVPGGEAFEL